MATTASEIVNELLEKESSMFPNSRIAAKAIAQILDREYENKWNGFFKWRFRLCKNPQYIRIYSKTKGNHFVCKINKEEWGVIKNILNKSLEYMIDIEVLWTDQLCDDIDVFFNKTSNKM